MPLLIKVNHASVNVLGCCIVEVRPYKGVSPGTDGPFFIWASEPSGDECLAMRGNRIELLRHGPCLELRIGITDPAPRRPLTLDTVQPYLDGGDSPVLVSLAGKLIRDAHVKVAEIDDEEARFLNGFFDELDR